MSTSRANDNRNQFTKKKNKANQQSNVVYKNEAREYRKKEEVEKKKRNNIHR